MLATAHPACGLSIVMAGLVPAIHEFPLPTRLNLSG